MGRIRVLNVITRLERGGAPQAMLEVVRRMSPAEWEVGVVTGRTEDPDRDMLEWALDQGFEVYKVPALRRDIHPLDDARAFWHLVRVIRAERPHLIHTHTSKAGLLGRLACRWCGVPAVVHSPHGTVLEGYFGPLATRLFASIDRLAAPWAHRIICLTGAEIDQYLAVRIGRRRQYTFVYNGIDVDAIVARSGDPGALRRSLGLSPQDLVCTTVGRLVPVKGHEDLIHAFGEAIASHPELCLVLVGEGELRGDLEDLARRLGLAERVRFTGWRDDVPELLSASDLFVLPSHNEGLGLVLVEAMAKRLPAVATAVGGVPEVVSDGETGILVPPRAPDELARAIGELAADAERRTRMGEAGYGRAVERFSVESTVRRTEEIYREVLGASG
jgi:glycosyltransferase involved in cell wall biosynthesis